MGESQDDAKAIRRSRDRMFQAFNESDLDGILAVIAEDVVWMSHTGPPATLGKEAVRRDYTQFFEQGPFVTNLICSSEEVGILGDWAFDRGTWLVTRTNKRGVRRERLESCYLTIWRRTSDGTWKIARMIWNGAPVPLRAPNSSKRRGKRQTRHRG